MDGRREGIEDAVAQAEDWEDLAARLADWDVVASGGDGALVLWSARGGGRIGTCTPPDRLGPPEAHFLG